MLLWCTQQDQKTLFPLPNKKVPKCHHWVLKVFNKCNFSSSKTFIVYNNLRHFVHFCAIPIVLVAIFFELLNLSLSRPEDTDTDFVHGWKRISLLLDMASSAEANSSYPMQWGDRFCMSMWPKTRFYWPPCSMYLNIFIEKLSCE